jgi:hypothetical protein
MMLLLAWISAALATTPGGFSHGTAQHVDSWSVRSVFIYTPDVEVIEQLTPRLSKSFDKYGVDVETSLATVTGPGGDIFAGVGAMQLSGWRLIKTDKGAHHRIGVVTGIPFVPQSMVPHAFGSTYQDTAMGTMAKLGWRVSWNEAAPWELQMHAGVGQSRVFSNVGPDVSPIVELALVKVLPLSDATSIVLEQDLILEHISQASFRPMVRRELTGAALDLGLQVPLMTQKELSLTPLSLQLLAQYQQRF